MHTVILVMIQRLHIHLFLSVGGTLFQFLTNTQDPILHAFPDDVCAGRQAATAVSNRLMNYYISIEAIQCGPSIRPRCTRERSLP
jgi:hypothetical protein